MNWPASLHSLIDRVRGEAHTRSRAYGVAKELGSIAVFMNNPINPIRYRILVRSEVENYYSALEDVVLRAPDMKANGEFAGYYTMTRTAEACRIPVKMLRKLLDHPDIKVIRARNVDRSPFMFNLEQIMGWNDRRLQLVGSLEAQKILGLPEYSLLHLVDHGFLTRDLGPAAVMMGCVRRNICLERAGLEDLANRLKGLGTRHVKIPEGFSLLSELLKTAPGLAPWNDIIDGVLDGRISIAGVLAGSSGIAGRLIIDPADIRYAVGQPNLQEVESDPDNLMSTNAAAELLGTTQVAITWLMNAGFIKGEKTGPNRRRPIRRSVYEFRRTFMLGGEVCRRTGIHNRALSLQLAKHGIYPAAKLQDGGRTIWRRVSISDLLDRNSSDPAGNVSGNWRNR